MWFDKLTTNGLTMLTMNRFKSVCPFGSAQSLP
jgi:hypothetical protein